MFPIETFGIECDELVEILKRIVSGDTADGFQCATTSMNDSDHANSRWFTWVDGT